MARSSKIMPARTVFRIPKICNKVVRRMHVILKLLETFVPIVGVTKAHRRSS